MQIRPFVLTARLAGCAASRAKNKSLSDFFAPAPRRGAAFYKLEYLILNRKRKNVQRWIKPQKSCLIFGVLSIAAHFSVFDLKSNIQVCKTLRLVGGRGQKNQTSFYF